MKLAYFILYSIIIVLLGAQFGENLWFFELFSHWVLQYWVVGLILWAIFLRKGHRFHIYLSFALVAFCSYLLLQSVFNRAPTTKIARPAAQIRIFEMNVQGKSETLRHWLPIQAGNYDVVVLLEAGTDFADVIESVKAELPYQVTHLDNSPFGIAILSRWPVAEKNEFKAEGGFYPQFELTIQAPGDEFLLYALHIPPPFAPQLAEAHEVILGELIEKLQQKKHPAIVVGDLNMTQYSKHYAKLLRLTGLRDSAGLSPWHHSWPALTVNLFSPLGIRIDQCLVSTTFSLVERERIEDLNSDHLPFKCIVQIEK